jgi:hypothetical protein
MSEPEQNSNTSSSYCSNPGCQYIQAQYDGMEKKLEHELWRASHAIQRARALRICANFILYCTSIFYIIFSDNPWARGGAAIMLGLCFKAAQLEG